MRKLIRALVLSAALVVVGTGVSSASADVRVTNDTATNTYQYSGGDSAYTDQTLQGCSTDRERQNEPAVEVDPRNPQLLLASSNDYCGVEADPVLSGLGPIWLGYYRSNTGGQSWVDSLVPGYPGDHSPASTRAFIDAASAGDPVIAWDRFGNAYFGAEASGSRDGSKKTNGDVWVARYRNPAGAVGNPAQDASMFAYSHDVAEGSQAPNLLGKFNDKTAIEVDRTGGRCDGRVYFAWSRFNGNGNPGIYFTYSADLAQTWSNPDKISNTQKDVQYSDIAVTKDGTVYVVWRQFEAGKQTDQVVYNVSHDCGRTFDNQPHHLADFIHYDAQDKPGEPQPAHAKDADAETGVDVDFEGHLAPNGSARDCGDGPNSCQSGFTFFRHDSQVRATADENDASNTVYVVYNATKPGTETPSGTTFGTITSGTASQSAVYFTTIRNGNPQGDGTIVDNQPRGHQVFPDVSAKANRVHVIWWDNRLDPSYSPTLPIGDTPSGQNSGDFLNVFGTSASEGAAIAFPPAARISQVGTNPNWEQFSGRTIPFAGDYLWVTTASNGTSYTVWTDWRNTVPGVDPRPFEADEPVQDGFDVMQCRTAADNYATDACPTAGGKDQNIYGSSATP